jgi:hypothetical protein
MEIHNMTRRGTPLDRQGNKTLCLGFLPTKRVMANDRRMSGVLQEPIYCFLAVESGNAR